MSLAVLYSRAQHGIDAPEVRVEVHLSGGMPRFSIVGLPEAAVRESRDRVRAAVMSLKFKFPQQRITVNLAPADLPKQGGRFDLAIALGVLAASGQIPHQGFDGLEFYGELSLSGDLRPFRGALPAAVQAVRAGRALVLPAENAREAILAQHTVVYSADTLTQVCGHVTRRTPMEPLSHAEPDACGIAQGPDLIDVRGQTQARRALEIAAAGAHSLLMIGPPGTGKSMLAMRLPGLLPPLGDDEALEAAAIRSVAGLSVSPETWRRRPFRAPHHTASSVALVGGGSNPRPGEISLAHRGVLFLDELPEFDRRVLESMREPLETGRVMISRAARSAEFPAEFQLLAAMNPCPCGYLGESRCRCTEVRVERYRARLSGPLLDRIDLHVPVPRVTAEALRDPRMRGEASDAVAARVRAARAHQIDRGGTLNARLDPAGLAQSCEPDDAGRALLERAMHQLGLSARAYHRVLRVARTIADLAGDSRIGARHIGEAIGLRSLDRGRGQQGST